MSWRKASGAVFLSASRKLHIGLFGGTIPLQYLFRLCTSTARLANSGLFTIRRE